MTQSLCKKELASAEAYRKLPLTMPRPPSCVTSLRTGSSLEMLESRFCPAGLIIENRHGNLLISGDPHGAVDLEQVTATKWRITDDGDLLGKFRCRRGLLIDLGSGDDQVTIRLLGAASPNRLVVDLGDGQNSLAVTSVADVRIPGAVKLRGGVGGDDFQVGTSRHSFRISGAFSVSGDASEDALVITNLDVDGGTILANVNTVSIQNGGFHGLQVSSGETDLDTILTVASGSRVLGKTTILTTSAGDSIDLSGRFNGPVLMSLGDGVNSFTARAARFGSSLQYEGGNGADAVVLLGRAEVAGEFRATFGDGSNRFESYAQSLFGRSVTLVGGGENDDVLIGGIVRGNLTIALNGGSNSALLGGEVRGNALQYFGGSGVDSVTYAEVAPRAGIRIDLGSGNDELIVASNSFATALFSGGEGEDHLTRRVTLPASGVTVNGFESSTVEA